MFITKTKTNPLHFYYRLEIKTGLTDGETILTNYFLFSTKHHQLSEKYAYSIQNHQQNRHKHTILLKTVAQSQTTNNLLTPIFGGTDTAAVPKYYQKPCKPHR